MTEPQEPRPAFDMDCPRCEYERECFPILKALHHIFGMECRQGRKRKVIRQQTIAEVLERYEPRKAEVTA